MKHIIVLLLGLFIYAPLHAQWVQTNGPYGGNINCFVESKINLFAGTDGGVFLSTNNGTSWSQTPLVGVSVKSLALSGKNIFAGTLRNEIGRAHV